MNQKANKTVSTEKADVLAGGVHALGSLSELRRMVLQTGCFKTAYFGRNGRGIISTF